MSCDACSLSQIRLAQCGDSQAIDALIRANQGLFHLLARRFCCAWMPEEELVQAGILGFMYALAHYDISMGTKLLTYAVPWILGEMRRALRKTEGAARSLDETMDETSQTLYDALSGQTDIDVMRLDLRLALSKLNEGEQTIICLRYFRDKTQKESAILLGKSQAQISRMERRALDALREILS